VGLRLDQQDVTAGADRRGHVQVEGDLQRPAGVLARVPGAAVLVHLAEAAVGGGARRQAVLAAVDREGRLGGGVGGGGGGRAPLGGPAAGGGWAKAWTIAIVGVAEPDAVSWYAERRSAGP